MGLIYLDHNATTPPDPQVTDAVTEACRDLWANPSSIHRFGQQVRQRIELAREAVAKLLGVQQREVIFTSGGTESNHLALHGCSPRRLITTRVEHSAVAAPAQAMHDAGVAVHYLDVDRRGLIDLDQLAALLADPAPGPGPGPGRTLVSIQWANNETGILQPIDRIAALLAEFRSRPGDLLLHTDATQAVGKIPIDLSKFPGPPLPAEALNRKRIPKNLPDVAEVERLPGAGAGLLPGAGVDLLSLSGHKFHGPKGVGALIVRRGVRLHPCQLGTQEHDQRGGTENVPGILGLGVAAELAGRFLADASRIERLRGLRDRLERRVREQLREVTVNPPDPDVPRLWNTSNLAFAGLAAEGMLVALSERGVCASAGAACSSGSLEPSPVLLAMGLEEPVAHGSVRLSLGRTTTVGQIDEAVEQIVGVARKLGRTMPMGG